MFQVLHILVRLPIAFVHIFRLFLAGLNFVLQRFLLLSQAVQFFLVFVALILGTLQTVLRSFSPF